MIIDDILFQKNPPRFKGVMWVEPKDNDNIELKIFNNGKWRPIAGGGNTTVNKYTSDPNAPMLSVGNVSAVLGEVGTKLGFNPNDELTLEQEEQLLNELKSYKFATPKQGNAVLVDLDFDNRSSTFQCDDGSVITTDRTSSFIGLRPDIDGYVIWGTTRDKLPVRESQEETDPGSPIRPKSVKSGLLGETLPTDPSTEKVYTVINNNTGEIVDPLELHKLTNVIWYLDVEHFTPYYVGEVASVGDLSPMGLEGLYNNIKSISTWVPIGGLKKYVSTFYDYTISIVNNSQHIID